MDILLRDLGICPLHTIVLVDDGRIIVIDPDEGYCSKCPSNAEVSWYSMDASWQYGDVLPGSDVYFAAWDAASDAERARIVVSIDQAKILAAGWPACFDHQNTPATATDDGVPVCAACAHYLETSRLAR